MCETEKPVNQSDDFEANTLKAKLESKERFKKELTHLINKHSVENTCDMPDFILAEMVVDFIDAVGGSIRKNLDWHGCDSVCHPKTR